jgi:hypothetical protein
MALPWHDQEKAPQRLSQQHNNGNGGVQGLKALGVRELTYRTCFVASSVISVQAMKTAKTASLLFGVSQQLNDHEPTPQEIAMEFTQQELLEIRDMKSSSNLYEKVCQIFFDIMSKLVSSPLTVLFLRSSNRYVPIHLATRRSSAESC